MNTIKFPKKITIKKAEGMKYCIEHLNKALLFAKLYEDQEVIDAIEQAIRLAQDIREEIIENV